MDKSKLVLGLINEGAGSATPTDTNLKTIVSYGEGYGGVMFCDYAASSSSPSTYTKIQGDL